MVQSDYNLQNSTHGSKKFEITGWEIVPYVPKGREEFKFSEYKVVLFETQLRKFIKNVVSQLVSPLRTIYVDSNKSRIMKDIATEPDPIAFKIPNEGDTMNPVRLDKHSIEQSSKIKLRNKTSNAGEIFVSFELPNEFPTYGLDVDKLPTPREKGRVPQNERRFLFSERLRGWKIERRQRINGRFDQYYYHEASGILLRSIVEVVNFLLYEDKPYKKATQNKSLVEGFNNQKRKRTRTYQNTKSTCSNSRNFNRKSGDQAAEDVIISKKIMVEKYLVDAHNNFLNSPNTKSHQLVITSQNENDQDEIQEKNYNTDNSSEATEEMFPAQKAGKFVQSSYIKLFNFSKEHVPKDDKKKNLEEPKGEEDQRTDSEATCSDTLISATNYFLGDKIAEVTSTLAKVTYEEIIKLAKVHDDDVNSASNVEVNQVDGIRSKHHVEELSHLKVEGSINLDKVDRDEIMSPSNEEINQVFETSSKPMEEISPMKVDAGSTSTHCEVVETNITDHGEAKDEDVKADLARDDKGELEVLSSFSDECDLINHIPLVDQGFFDDLKK